MTQEREHVNERVLSFHVKNGFCNDYLKKAPEVGSKQVIVLISREDENEGRRSVLRRGLLRNLLVQNAPVEPVLGQQMAKILDDCQNNVQGSEMIDKTMNLRFGVFRHVSSRGHNSHVRVLLFSFGFPAFTRRSTQL